MRPDDELLALTALAHVVGDPGMGPRFLGLTGLDAATLRARAGEPATLAALIHFLCAHEPDLVATAHALRVSPERLAACGRC